MAEAPQKRAMRRGLSALMADVGVSASDMGGRGNAERTLPIEQLHPNPDQPRRTFNEQELSDLAASIAQKGILQPLIVRRDPKREDGYQIVAGERRWRAAQRAGLHEAPVVIRDLDDTEVLEIGIIENIQRADLNAIEEAQGFRQLMERFGHTQDQLSTVLGKSRSHIANLMRLLKLPDSVQEYVRLGTLSAGHARALINAPDAERLARNIISKGLSVRETERLVKSATEGETQPRAKTARAGSDKDADTRALEGDLSAALSMAVSIDHDSSSEGGSVMIRYKSLDDLDRLCGLLSSGA
ncbi:ParB/RepB/Spo0J family partition protein [Jannaschia pohangensis]|uniref:Chromosome segregation DNA-binding protein n=1 Tax=Jannaschia pohangensis TaxID=390807 RepID=A0A1I3TDG2_9RHOB|nr:ParB/RepB/Spo0J family partition protein [Jannaschia pohangensis]SFJ69164.1 chromosome segregation DNA-binding protein [Jannaschia pohangensis]